ncbi:HAD-IA family hydrolase [Streptomyces mirabilis]|uniref:HAD-IA family hydrolase n=1 Tax=Streptomyces mirabilis TaxID=68239 RepID=UPI003660EAD2
MSSKLPFACQAILFDLDGVLVDSLALSERILRDWAAARRLDPDAAVTAAHGRRDIDLIRHLAPDLDAHAEARAIASQEEAAAAGLKSCPGAFSLLEALPPSRWAVVTSGARRVAVARLRATGLPMPWHVIAAEDINHGKPNPEGYLKAAALLDSLPRHCLVIEDAQAGVEAAHAAGMACIGVGPSLVGNADVDAWVEGVSQLWLAVRADGIEVIVNLGGELGGVDYPGTWRQGVRQFGAVDGDPATGR